MQQQKMNRMIKKHMIIKTSIELNILNFRLGMQAIKQLHPDIISSVQSKTLFSKEEEKLLGTVLSVSTSMG